MNTGVRILVAGIGNVFKGDDAFGVEVAKRLLRRCWPAEVQVTDFGVRGLDLSYTLLDGYDVVVLIDAAARGGEPGSIYLIELDTEPISPPDSQRLLFEAHDLVPDQVIRWAKFMGARLPCVRIVACEPATVGSEEDLVMGLSQAVEAAIPQAVQIVEQLVEQSLTGQPGLVR